MTQAESLGKILDFWHKVEFFIPFDLKQVFDQTDQKYLRWLTPDDLRQEARSPWQVSIPNDRELTGFRLYVGVFDMQILSDFARTHHAHDARDATEEAERTALDGRSCIARIVVNAQGESQLDPVSVSTVPWAVGTAQQKGLAALSAEAFEQARSNLSTRLFNYTAERLKDRQEGQPLPLSGQDILALQDLLLAWAGCTFLSSPAAALLEILTKEKKAEAPPSGLPAATDGSAARPDTQAAEAHDDEDEDETPEEDLAESAEDEPAIDILNSFYIEDIERCMASIRHGDVPATILAYLTPGDAGQRTDLYGDAGRQAILRAIHPARTAAGRWPDEPSQKMSLMQQFAINTAFETLATEGLFSVNGPPGTGKTTLLREIFCENIVRRARELARLASAADGLAKTATQIHFANGKTAWIRTLLPSLAGFEMVVASSNNAAVENISKDLPKQERLAGTWSSVRYLQPVAHKVAAQIGETRIGKLAAADVPWGMISCALGNSKNRRRFVDRVFFDKRPEKKRGGPGAPCTIWDWHKRYAGPSFQTAKRTFLDADAALQSAIQDRLAHADLHARWADVPLRQYLQQAADMLAAREAQQREAASKHEDFTAAARNADVALANLQEEERLLDRARPGLFARLVGTAVARRHAADIARNAHAQIAARQQADRCRSDVAAAAATLHSARTQAELARAEIGKAHATWQERQDRLEESCQRLHDLSLPAEPGLIETDEVQKNGYWQDAALAKLRTQIFIAALALHEAWLADVLQARAFGGNLFAVSALLGGAALNDPAQTPLIWQSLFMMVPVVSTTFASFSRQFRGMGPGSIGWLFVDEGGQAVPQAATGALWRARRAMVVGDPLQIEPVFTVPARLINALANLSACTADGQYSPNHVSAQRLADQANAFGTLVPMDDAEPLWIGSPLRVHRRCVDPMYSIANRIAYRDKMVFGLASRQPREDPLRLGSSAWVDVRGRTTERQVVPAQIDAVQALIEQLHAATGALPPLYVISPFKAIRNALMRQLKQIDWRRITEDAPASKTWHEWCEARIGTVHTFQGKEQSVVIVVLGTDADSAEAAAWAASKPNLLNVAVTRAQHRLFIVGDASLWGPLKYFSEALARLGTPISKDQWLGRIAETRGPGESTEIGASGSPGIEALG